MKPYCTFYLLFFLFSTSLYAQVNSTDLKNYIMTVMPSDNDAALFYSSLNYTPVWVNKENGNNRIALMNAIDLATGIDKNNYDIGFIRNLYNGGFKNTLIDTIETEWQTTRTAMRFYRDVIYGNTIPQLSYNGLSPVTESYDISYLLREYISKQSLHLLVLSFQSRLPELIPIEDRIRKFKKIISEKLFHETIVTSNKVTAENQPLVIKLYQLGIIDTVSGNFPDKALIQKVKEAQQLFNLLADGVLRSTIIKELNVPLSMRMHQLNLSVNYYRWLSCLSKGQSVIVVNIPAAYMKVYHENEVVLQMRMVVGKPSTPTPTLASKINEVILYPYWHVPYSIATKELLPAIKRNPGYINDGNYQVLNKAGKIVNPYSVNWRSLSTKNFPYLIRQSTGCDNALGLLKLNFYSPFGVYLHDTPVKGSFVLYKRFFSHGCMRMEKPMELGHLVLKHNAIAIDTLEEKGCLRNQSPIVVKADVQMPVIVWYNPAGIDSKGKLVFFEDVYGKFHRRN